MRQGSSPKHENTTYKPVDARGASPNCRNYRQPERIKGRFTAMTHKQRQLGSVS